ncbi:unnamed protein product [Rotaria magnacalcarata]
MTDGQATSLFSSDRLLGLDEIESGFDVMSMVSLAESESRFRIFDLSDTGPNEFRVSVLGQQRMFNIPLNVQVTNINTRRVINCEDLSNDYKHFYSNYFRSSSNGLPVLYFMIIGRIANRHGALRVIEEAINKESKTVATSTSWWGIYSIQLEPPLFIKFDPMFNASMSAIINKQHVPRTESEQTLYNILLETFGTHYVTRVIVGATAHMYTLINNAFTKSATFEETASEVSRMSNSFFLPKIVPRSIHSIKESLSESFRKNSKSFVEYQPPVALVPGKTEWQSWLDNAVLTPVVVNRTLAPLSNIFYRYPLIRGHLRRTIDHYLRHGKYPKLGELNR